MVQLDFIGKEYIRTHHFSVPHRVLVHDKKRSLGNADEGNLIMHGGIDGSPPPGSRGA